MIFIGNLIWLKITTLNESTKHILHFELLVVSGLLTHKIMHEFMTGMYNEKCLRQQKRIRDQKKGETNVWGICS